ncbi:unnamed protein product [Mytilus coruscus]|uniref:Uncharacterized protein n=1 Tax=Mytilus coruscus TaxID=42192 RepID=A0A6J8BX96_MYTCO|nr:unnamed protein product [Mytilus coruscus]
MQYLQTRAGTCLSANDVIKCTDNDILKLYQPGLGGVRESPVHPGDYCGPCSLCKKDMQYIGQQQHDKKVECVSPREYVSLILKQAVSGTLDIDIPDINKLALTELIKFFCTELMQNKALLLSEMVYKFEEFGGCFSSNLRQNQTRFILDKLQFIFSSNIDTDKVDKIGTIVKLHGVEDQMLSLGTSRTPKREVIQYKVRSCQLSV